MDLSFCISQGLGRDQRVFSKEMGEDKLMKGLFLSSVNGSQKGLWKLQPIWKPLTALLGTNGRTDYMPRYFYMPLYFYIRTICLVTSNSALP